MGGTKYDDGKPMMSLLDPLALTEIAKVLTFGCEKYQPHNWRKGFAWSRLLDAALRHIFAFVSGEDKDPETGYSHIAHACCCLIFLLNHEQTKKELDDRYKQDVSRFKAGENSEAVETKQEQKNEAGKGGELNNQAKQVKI